MQNEFDIKRIFYLREVEKLSMRQIADILDIDRRKISQTLKRSGDSCVDIKKPCLLDSYYHLIKNWYSNRPKLKATQIYKKLQSYDYQGSYESVVNFTQKYRKKKKKAYHTLEFLPGEEAQIDWFFYKSEIFGKVAGFLYVLSYSRYAWGIFYPRTTFEFFLNGHIECFNHIGGYAHAHRYDNLSSVVLKRNPQIQYNPQFLDFARFYAFDINLCNVASGNEKGRVERLIRDIRLFLYEETFASLEELNQKFHIWLTNRNNRIHRTTNKTPKDLLCEEKLIALPRNTYPAKKNIPNALISKTTLVEFDKNKYSVPSCYSQQRADIAAFTDRIDIYVHNKKVATHKRSFKIKQIIRNPLHSEKLLAQTPKFKMQRIFQLIANMDPEFQHFLQQQKDNASSEDVAYQLFKLLKIYSKIILISAIRELNQMNCYKIKALKSLLNLPTEKKQDDLWPANTNLLNLNYEERNLNEYDELI